MFQITKSTRFGKIVVFLANSDTKKSLWRLIILHVHMHFYLKYPKSKMFIFGSFSVSKLITCFFRNDQFFMLEIFEIPHFPIFRIKWKKWKISNISSIKNGVFWDKNTWSILKQNKNRKWKSWILGRHSTDLNLWIA